MLCLSSGRWGHSTCNMTINRQIAQWGLTLHWMHFHNWQNPISLIGPMVPKWMSRVTKQRVPINLISHKLIPIYQTRSPLNCWRWRGGPVSASSDIGTGPARQQESGPTIFKLNSTVDTQQCSRRLAASAESGPADRDSSTATSKINAIREWWLLGFFRHLATCFNFGARSQSTGVCPVSSAARAREGGSRHRIVLPKIGPR